MLADISGLIGLIVFVVIAIVASFLKRKEESFELPPELKPRREQPPQAPPPPYSAPPVKRSWEEELRALLEDRPAPPPITQQAPPVPPPIIYPTARRIEVQPEDEEGGRTAPFPASSGFRESNTRYAEASHLQQRVMSRMAEVSRHRVGTTLVERRAISAEAQELVTALRSPKGVRHAVLASIILGPPRALET